MVRQGTLTPSFAGSNPAGPAKIKQKFFCRETQAFSNKVTQKVAKDRDLAIGLFLYIDII